MAHEDDAIYNEVALTDMNDWASIVHGEIQSNADIGYPETDVRPLDDTYRKQIGNYLTENFNLDYTAVLFFLDGMESVYHLEDDLFLVSYESLQERPGNFERGVISHEQGHRFGKKFIEKVLRPLEEDIDSDTDLNLFKTYLHSENFAERMKVAIGNTLGRDFSYWKELSENSPAIYGMRDRIGPEELVDPERDEDLPEMMEALENTVTELENGSTPWN